MHNYDTVNTMLRKGKALKDLCHELMHLLNKVT